jgi:hypothetical protein
MKKILFALVLCTLGFGCTKDFEKINQNPNEPSEVSGDLLLRTCIYNLANGSVGDSYAFTDIVAQYHALYEYNQLDIYNWTSDGRFWWMYDVLQDLKGIEAYGRDNNLPNYEAVSLILQSYTYSILTDAYGDVPFSESNKATEGIVTPKYDTQESIYNAMFAALERANQIIVPADAISGDLLFSGDMLKWKKFGNSLHFRLLNRAAHKNATLLAAFNAKFADPAKYPVFESNADAAVYRYSGRQPDVAPYSSASGREYEYYIGVPTTHFIETLEKNDDPRIHEWLDYHEADNGELSYKGLEPGLNQNDIGRAKDYATKDPSFYTDPTKNTAILMSYSELCFIFAEAAMKANNSSVAKNWYDLGVQASFDQWNVPMPADFLTTTVPYDQANPDRLYEQKWLALYHAGLESWFDWKRTGKPAFIQAGPGNVNNNKVPVRLMYPSLEQSVNGINYEQASQRIGGDNINSRVWWDKQ